MIVVFIVGSKVYKQIRSVAIGGTASARNASLFCMWREHLALKGPKNFQKHMSKHFPPHMMPIHPYRYLDNIVGILCAIPDYNIQHILSFLQKVYTLKL